MNNEKNLKSTKSNAGIKSKKDYKTCQDCAHRNNCEIRRNNDYCETVVCSEGAF